MKDFKDYVFQRELVQYASTYSGYPQDTIRDMLGKGLVDYKHLKKFCAIKYVEHNPSKQVLRKDLYKEAGDKFKFAPRYVMGLCTNTDQ